jgi:hypothetical protein
MTDHHPPRGLILYDIRGPRRRRRQRQRAVDHRVLDFDWDFPELMLSFQAKLPKVIPFYDPDLSIESRGEPYVIIVPNEFFNVEYVKRRIKQNQKDLQDMRWNKFRIRPPVFLLPIPEAVANVLEKLAKFANKLKWMIVAAAAVGVIIIAPEVLLVAPEAAEAIAVTEAGVAAGEAGVVAATSAGEAAALESSIVVPGTIAARVAPSAMAGYQTMVQTVAGRVAQAGAAGVVLTLGNVAHADVKEAANPSRKPSVDNVAWVKVVPLADFTYSTLSGNLPVGFSARREHQGVMDTPEAEVRELDGKRFRKGSSVMYDNIEHSVVGYVFVS